MVVATDSSKSRLTSDVLLAHVFMATWITLSSGVILINKWILDPKMGNFPFPITLTTIHMASGTLLSWGAIRAGLVTPVSMALDTYMKNIVPVGALFAWVLWGGNTVYMYLTVSFLQMLKATMPMFVYSVGCCFGTEAVELRTTLNLLVVVSGIMIASWGEVVFVAVGVVLQLSCNLAEAIRLSLVQILLQQQGVRLNPVQTLAYVAPACLVFLLLPCLLLEAPQVLEHTKGRVGLGSLLASAMMAFGLNCSVFLLVGKTSALTMNIAGIVKDLLLIMASVVLYRSEVTLVQWCGYTLALTGVSWYNYARIAASKPPPSGETAKNTFNAQATDERGDVEKQGLVAHQRKPAVQGSADLLTSPDNHQPQRSR